jgi:hypothetical protein
MLILPQNKALNMSKHTNYSLIKYHAAGKTFLFATKLCIVFVMALFMGKQAFATEENYSALTKNAALETASLNKAPSLANNNINFKNIGNAQLNDQKITKKSKELEGVFLSVMIEPMFPEGKESNLYGGGQGNGVFRSMMIQQYGKIFADAGGVGLSDGIEKQFRKKQAAQ